MRNTGVTLLSGKPQLPSHSSLGNMKNKCLFPLALTDVNPPERLSPLSAAAASGLAFSLRAFIPLPSCVAANRASLVSCRVVLSASRGAGVLLSRTDPAAGPGANGSHPVQ